MTKLFIEVSDKNKGFILYNHLFVKKEPFSIKELQQELKNQYGLEVTNSWLRFEIEEYLDSGLVMHEFDKYISTMQRGDTE